MTIIRITLVSVLVFTFLIFSGCKKNSPDLFSSQYQNMMRESALAEAAFDDALKMAENILMNNGNAKTETAGAPVGCITDIDTVVTGPNSKRYTVTFPGECTSYDGKYRTGAMMIDLIGANYNTTGSSITLTFNSYTINGNPVQGKLVATNVGNSEFTVVVSDDAGTGYALMNLLSLGKIFSWRSTQRRIIVGGNGDNIMINNKYSIHQLSESIMTFEGVTSDNKYYFGNPGETGLGLDNSCFAAGNLRYPIDGEIVYKMEGQHKTVDYGDGNCDYGVTMISGNASSFFSLY